MWHRPSLLYTRGGRTGVTFSDSDCIPFPKLLKPGPVFHKFLNRDPGTKKRWILSETTPGLQIRPLLHWDDRNHIFDYSCYCFKKVTSAPGSLEIGIPTLFYTPVGVKTWKQFLFCIMRKNHCWCCYFAFTQYGQVMSWFQCWQAVSGFLSALHEL